MKTSKSGIENIKSYERLKLKAYKCPAGVWTIGYGHTRGVKQGQTISVAQAEQLFVEDLTPLEKCVNRLNVNLTQSQFDALVSFVFNVGEPQFNTSTLRKVILNGNNIKKVQEQLRKWKYSKGKVLSGLERRRETECKMYER